MRAPAIIIALLLSLASNLPAQSLETERDFDWYKERYPFMKLRGTLFTFETEFEWPRGFRRPDSTSLTAYQFWVSHFPLWHRDKDVTAYTRGKVFDAEEVSRVVHLPWRVARLTDCAVPVQLLAEYHWWRRTVSEWVFLPIRGDTLRYDDFLKSEVIYQPRKTVRLRAAEERTDSEDEFNRFVDLCAMNTDYQSLAAGGDSISMERLAPGDLFIARDEKGRRGQVWVVLCMLINDDGDRLYAVGTACPETCAFHIPLFNDNRKYPWLTAESISKLGGDFPQSGFFRPRID
ncbi:hypothetical protein KKA00_02630 [bacterium]|nr:hypothetical protein [bacterium]